VGVFDREHYFRDLLAKQVGGRTEVALPFGRADVMTDTTVWEVEPASRYPAGVRQAFQYAAQTGLTAALATYGPSKLVTKVFDHLAKLPAPGVELWWLHERRFVPVKSADEAQTLAGCSAYGYVNRWPGKADSLPCEVTWHEGEVMHSCDAEPCIWEPIRLCQEHFEEAQPYEARIPGPMDKHPCRDDLNLPVRTAACELKTADDLAVTLARLAWPHLDPDDRDLLGAYLIEVRSVLWNAAAWRHDYAKAWGDFEPDEYEPAFYLT
jgi:hypothetical protein